MNIGKHLILFFLTILIPLFHSYSLPQPNDIQNAKTTLIQYLSSREQGKFSECLKFCSNEFLENFKKRLGTDYVDYYRNQDENDYKNFRILDVSKKKELILIKVSIEVFGQGYKSKALENYSMVRREGRWKILDWNIDYKK
jgi:hypothetical protein